MTTNVWPTFWQKTLASFETKPVQMRLRNGLKYRGVIDSIGGTAATIRIGDKLQLVHYVDLLECTE